MEVHKVLECPQNEILALQCLDEFRHPLLLQYFDAWQDEVSRYTVTEYCQEQSAYTFLHRREENMMFFRRLALNLLDGLQFLHSKGIAHRDVSPENTLVAKAEYGVVLKLMDFAQAIRVFPDGGTLNDEKKVPHEPGLIRPGKKELAPPEIFYRRSDFCYESSGAFEQVKDGYYATALDVFQCGLTLFGMRCGARLIAGRDDHMRVFPPAVWWKQRVLPEDKLLEAVRLEKSGAGQHVLDLPAEGPEDILKYILERMLAPIPICRLRSEQVMWEMIDAWPLRRNVHYTPQKPCGVIASAV